MTIAAGDRVPDAVFRRIGADGTEELTTADLFGGKRIVMFGVPGAFTPTCHNRHLPGYVQNAARFHELGVDTVACVAVNDAFVMDAWGKASGADGILFLSDWDASFARAAGLEMDRSATLGVRFRRFALLAEDGIVRAVNIDDVPGQVEGTSAERMLSLLDIRT